MVLCALAVLLRLHHMAAEIEAAKDPFSLTNAGDNKSYADKITRYRAGAGAAVRSACTNEIIGLRGIISLDVQTYDDNFKKWTATATVEYINHIGGVDRTNLSLRFDPVSGQPAWFPQD